MPPSLTSINFTKSFFCVRAHSAPIGIRRKPLPAVEGGQSISVSGGRSRQRSLAQPGEQLLHLHDVVPHPGDLLPRVALLVRIERDRVREENPLRQREHDDLAIGFVEREGRLKFHLSVFPYGDQRQSAQRITLPPRCLRLTTPLGSGEAAR